MPVPLIAAVQRMAGLVAGRRGRGATSPADRFGWSGSLFGSWAWNFRRTGDDDDLDLGEARWLSATQRCVGLLSDVIAASPMYVARAVPRGGRQVVDSTDASRAIALLSFHDRECLVASLLIDGNAFARLRRNARGGVTAIEPLAPLRVTIAIDDAGGLWYRLAPDSTLRQPAELLPAADVLHIRMRPSAGSGFLLGVPPLAAIATSLQTVLRVNTGAASYFRNLSLPSFLLSTDLILTPDQVKELRGMWAAQTSGENLGGVPILTAGLRGAPVPGDNALQSQLLEMSRLSVAEIGRAYGVPSSYLNETSSLNFATAAEQTRSLVTSTLSPLAARVADALSQALLSREERLAGLAVTIDLSDLVVGQGVERADYASKLVNAGLASPNEVRDTLGYPDVAGGDALRVPTNTQPLDTWRQGDPKPVATAPGAPQNPSPDTDTPA